MKKITFISLIFVLLSSCYSDRNSVNKHIIGTWNCIDYSDSDDLRKGEPPTEVSYMNNQGYQILDGGTLYLIFNEYNTFDSTYQQTVDNTKYSWYLSDDESKLFFQINGSTPDEYEITALSTGLLGIKTIKGYNIIEGRTYYFD